MRFLKLFFASVVVLFLVVCFVFALFPAHITISRVINITATDTAIKGWLGDLKMWPKWNAFANDTLMENINWSVPSSGTGAYMKSAQKTISIKQSSDRLLTTWWQTAGKKGFAGSFRIVPVGSRDFVVQWTFDFYFKWYPWEKMGSIFYDKQLGPIMERSLLQLKKRSENPVSY